MLKTKDIIDKVTIDDLKNIDIPLPEIHIQAKINSIISEFYTSTKNSSKYDYVDVTLAHFTENEY